jgi:antirestriction protein ArdC
MYAKTSSKVNYSEITAKVIELMEQGILPLGSQWESGSNKMLPFNLATGKMYRGMNILHLWIAEMTKEYSSNGWMTINQMRKIATDDELDEPIRLKTLPENEPGRGNGKTGQKGVQVFHADTFIPKEWKLQQDDVYRSERSGDYSDENGVRRSYLKVVGTVFNLEQIENLPEKYKVFDALEPLEVQQPIITTMTEAYGVPIEVSNDGSCYYLPRLHKIRLVHQRLFKTPADFERVKFHELVHSTGHDTLLNREGVSLCNSKDIEKYAFEELVAELGAAFMCAHFGIPGLMVHAGYLSHYCKVLRKDDRAIFRAAAKAQAAVELLLSHLPKQEESNASTD